MLGVELPLAGRRDQAVLDGAADQLGGGLESERLHGLVLVSPNGAGRQRERGGDFLQGPTLCDQRNDRTWRDVGVPAPGFPDPPTS